MWGGFLVRSLTGGGKLWSTPKKGRIVCMTDCSCCRVWVAGGWRVGGKRRQIDEDTTTDRLKCKLIL